MFRIFPLLFIVSIHLIGQVPYVVKDLNTQAIEAGSFPSPFYSVNGKHFFRADDGVHGAELWVTDGTSTSLFRDVRMGYKSSSPEFLAVLDGKLVISALDVKGLRRIWVIDGVNIHRLELGQINIFNPQIVAFNGQFFLSTGDKLFRTDLSATGHQLLSPSGTMTLFPSTETFFIKKHNPGGLSAYDPETDQQITLLSGDLGETTVFGATLTFGYNDQSSGEELWTSDGTVEGTQILIDLNEGSDSSYPEAFEIVDGSLMFRAVSRAFGRELWKTDGTALGTTLVVDLVPGSAGLVYRNHVSSDRLYFFSLVQGSPEKQFPFVSDGSAEGTFQLGAFVDYSLITFYKVGNEIYFSAYSTTQNLYEYWKTDGSVNGTTRIFTSPSSISPMGQIGNDHFYSMHGQQTSAFEPYKGDGTSAPSLFQEINPNYSHTYVSKMASFQKGVVFQLRNNELMTSFGNEAQTQLLASYTEGFEVYGDQFLYSEREDPSQTISTIKRSDGLKVDTLERLDIQLPIDGLINWNNYLFFGRDSRWYRYAKNEGELTSFYSLEFDETKGYAYLNDTVLFVNNDNRLMKTNGLENGTNFVFPENDQPYVEVQKLFGNGHLGYFYALEKGNEGIGVQLWISDGTSEGTQRLTHLSNKTQELVFQNETQIGDKLYFSASSDDLGLEPWVTDGTEVGTRRIKDLNPGPNSSMFVSWFVSMNDVIYFAADDGVHGLELWRTDGTENGTTMVADIHQSGDGDPSKPVIFGDRLYFAASTSDHGRELWTSDGTAQGTGMVHDIFTGTASSSPVAFRVSEDYLYMLANNGSAGVELMAYSPAPVVVLTHEASLCVGTDSSARVSNPRDGATFLWEVTNANVNGGVTGAEILFTPTTAGDVTLTVTVTYHGVSSQKTVVIDANDGIPVLPGVVTGPNEVCPNSVDLIYSVAAVDNALSYEWTVPPGAVITEGQGTAVVQVTLSDESGVVSVQAVNACGSSSASETLVTLKPGVSPAFAGSDRVACFDEIALDATTPAMGMGRWRIHSGEGGQILEPNNPQSVFQGTAGQTYELEWLVSSEECGTSVDYVTIVFTERIEAANAGPDQEVCSRTTRLNGNQPEWGTGFWVLLSGENGQIRDRFDPQSEFDGVMGQVYELEWVVRGKPCEISRDQVQLTFYQERYVYAGEDRCVYGTEPFALNAFEPTGLGRWSVVSSPRDGGGLFSDAQDPHALFTPSAGVGLYVLKWTVSSDSCDDLHDLVDINVAYGDESRLVARIGTPVTESDYSFPQDEAVIHDLFFFQTGLFQDHTLWVTDGTTDGTHKLAMFPEANTVFTDWTLYESNVYFREEFHNKTLWVTDGTTDGTEGVRDYQGTVMQNVSLLTSVGEQLFFIQDSNKIWRLVDGYARPVVETQWQIQGLFEIGGQLVVSGNGQTYACDYLTGALETISQDAAVGPVITYKEEHYFLADNSLVRSDGTVDGTETAIATPPTRISRLLLATDDFIYFLGDDSQGREVLWRSDGSLEGTIILKEVIASDDGIEPSKFFALNGHLVFKTNGGVYISDGTITGTQQLTEQVPSSMVQGENHAYFVVSANGQTHVWRSDGTLAGSEAYFSVDYSLELLARYNGQLWYRPDFSETEPGYRELWMLTDTGETSMLRDFTPPGSEEPVLFGNAESINGNLVFHNSNGVHISDGLTVQHLTSISSFNPAKLGNSLIFEGGDNNLWKSDGTLSGSSILTRLGHTHQFTRLKDHVYFLNDIDFRTNEIWRTDGTALGTEKVTGLASLTSTKKLHATEHALYVVTNNDQLWFSNGSVTDRITQFSGSSIETLLSDQGLFFRASDSDHMYHHDGFELRDLGAYPLFDAVVYGRDRFWYVPRLQDELWVSDDAGARKVVDASGISSNLRVINNHLYFYKDRALWFTDGTAENTRKLLDTALLGSLVLHQGRVYFTAFTEDFGIEPWTTDGTVAGTRLLADIYPGKESSNAHNFYAFNDKLYFSAFGHQGRQLYYTDGGCTLQVSALDSAPDNFDTISLRGSEAKLYVMGSKDFGYLYVLDDAHVNIYDAEMLDTLLPDFDQDNNGRLSPSEMNLITELDISGTETTNLKGVESMIHLERLFASENKIQDLGPLLANPNIGTQAHHQIDLRRNHLGESSCESIHILEQRADASGATLLIGTQTKFGFPEYEQFPEYNILAFLAGTELEATLECVQ